MSRATRTGAPSGLVLLAAMSAQQANRLNSVPPGGNLPLPSPSSRKSIPTSFDVSDDGQRWLTNRYENLKSDIMMVENFRH